MAMDVIRHPHWSGCASLPFLNIYKTAHACLCVSPLVSSSPPLNLTWWAPCWSLVQASFPRKPLFSLNLPNSIDMYAGSKTHTETLSLTFFCGQEKRQTSLNWIPCFDNPQISCAVYDAPLDYANESAGKARLAVIKYAATSTNRIGTVFVNPGEFCLP